MTDDELARLEAVARAATQDDWDFNYYSMVDCSKFVDSDEYICTVPPTSGDTATGEHLANAIHIAAFDPPTVLALLAELRELRADLDELQTRYNRAYKAIQAWEDGDQFTAGYEVGYNDGESSAEADLAARLDP
jgi:hypothetical protein